MIFVLKNKHFGGVINKADLTKLMKKVYVINLDKRNGSGSHWTLVSNLDPKHIFYFDSFGEVPPEHILKLMKATGKIAFYNKQQFQLIKSDSCGEFCSYVAKELMKGRNPKSVMADFSSNLNQNEKVLEKYFGKI